MSSNAITIPGIRIEGKPWVETLHEWVTTVDHKRLGILYVIYALGFLVVGGVEALIIRIQLMHSHNDFVSPQVFNRLFTMHGTTMIFFVVMPIMFGFANYLVPLMIGARRLAVSCCTSAFLEEVDFTAQATHRTSAGGPMRRWERGRSRLDIAPIIGHFRSWFRGSGASEPQSTLSPQFFACDALA